MNTKLTLTIEQDVIAKAKEYAKAQQRSLSDIIENYLRSLTSTNKNLKEYKMPVVSSLQGSFREPENFDSKKELNKRREDKYLK